MRQEERIDCVVAKLGSSLQTNEHGLDLEAIDAYTAGMKQSYIDQGQGLIVVTSGAVAAGRHRAEQIYGTEQSKDLTLQQVAALGATALFSAYEQGFEKHGVAAASIAITHRQLGGGSLRERFSNRKEKKQFMQTLRDNCRSGIVTIINEADAISIVELMELKCGGDNDGLASHLAIAIGASSLLLFTKSGGVRDENRQHIDEVNRSNHKQVKKMLKNRAVSDTGRGGMATKDRAAWRAAKKGVKDVRIVAIDEKRQMTGERATRYVVG